jgi:hypothetical protein
MFRNDNDDNVDGDENDAVNIYYVDVDDRDDHNNDA